MNRLLFLFFLSFSFLGTAQRQSKVDFIHGAISIEPIPGEKRIIGTVIYEFSILEDVDSVFLDAKAMKFQAVLLDGEKIKISNNGNIISIKNRFRQGEKHRLQLTYSCFPKQTVYFLGWEDGIADNEQIWTQGQGKYTSHWLPSFDDMEEKIEFDLNVITPSRYQVIANGALAEKGPKSDDKQYWSFDMQKPMSSYLLAFAIGDYAKQELTSSSGISIENYYYPQDSSRAEPTYRYTKQIFDFLENEIGVPYPWQNYKQIPVRDFLYAGMENTGATIFSDGYVIDSTAFIDKNYVNVNAHELAHQWFGNLVTEKDGNHHWLHEGFATYYAYLAEKKIFGDDHFYWKLYKSLTALQNTIERGEGQSLSDPRANSQTFYQKGAWALFMLREEIGSTAFIIGIQNYLEKYRFKNVTIGNFLEEMEGASGKKLSDFKKEWLRNTKLPFQNAQKKLAEKSPSLALLFAMEADLKKAKSDTFDFMAYLSRTKSMNFKKHVLTNYFEVLPEDIITEAFTSDTIPIRQVLATKIDRIPSSLISQYESLLKDKSYTTQENILLKLWLAFPEQRKDYLNKTKNTVGLPNKSIRLLWLALAILTDTYEAEKTQQYFTELTAYTSPEYGWETRLGAFQYLSEIGFTDIGLKNLINASVHHSWQFKKFSRSLLDQLLEDTDYKTRIERLSKELKAPELRYMNTKLNKK